MVEILLLGSFVWIICIAAAPPTSSICPGSGEAPALTPVGAAEDFGPQILAYLNALGSPNGLQEAFSMLHDPANPNAIYQARIISRDVTGDGIEDVIANLSLPALDNRVLFVFTCQAGKYVTLYRNTDNPTLRAVKDMNLDGAAEILYSSPDCTVGCMIYYDILEWNGKEFASLTRNNDPPCYGPCIVSGYAEIADLTHNGTLALILVEGWNIQYGPGCEQRDAWTWNGKSFVKGSHPYCLPQYRIHAVYAGDDASLTGEYNQALGYYQQVIFEAGMLPGRDWQQHLDSPSKFFAMPDPVEWAGLSAYARYRILLLQILWQDEPSAQLVYRTLENRFPAGAPGHAYAALASAFWEAYSPSHNLASACSQAGQFAAANAGDILTPLSRAIYGKNNRDYQPIDICPFK